MQDKIVNIRNFGIIAHSGAGKTSLAEAVLYLSKSTDRLGKVDDGTSILDFEPEEIKRRITINSAFHHYTWKKTNVTLVDTPGDDNFISDTLSSLQVVDGALVVVDAIDGVKVQTEKVWNMALNFNLPRIIFINKMDRERADFFNVLGQIESVLKARAVPLTIPWGAEESFKGCVHLLQQKAYIYTGGAGESKTEAVPAELQDSVEEWREKLIEHIAETDDALLEKYLDGRELTPEELSQGLRNGIIHGKFAVVLCGSAAKLTGIDLLLDTVNQLFPSPIDRGPKDGEDPKTKQKIQREPSTDAPL